MGWYSIAIFPRLCDYLLNQPFVTEHRKRLLSQAAGSVLEIGFGTGLNLPHYPQSVHRITAADPNVGMHRLAQRRIRCSTIPVDHRVSRSEQLPLADDSFDCAVSTFTLCSIPGVSQALSEVFRVLRPGGRFLFLEHGLSPDPSIQKWQRRLNWLQMHLADGCRLDRDIKQLVAAQPFCSVESSEQYLERTPKSHGYLYYGHAIK
jgi:ubiquinone/menaquinone biosynthesis C-methylase UbiE